MRIILEPQSKYRATSHRPSRPFIPPGPGKQLVLQVTDDDGYFDHLSKQELSRSKSEEQAAIAISARQTKTKESLLTKLFGGKPNADNNVPNGRDEETSSPLGDANTARPLARDGHHSNGDTVQDSPKIPSVASVLIVSDNMPTLPTASSEEQTLPLISPNGPAAVIMEHLKLESSRTEISLLALGILVLVINMGIVMWIGVKRRRQSEARHRKEQQQHTTSEAKVEDNKENGANLSRLSSTRKLLRSSLLASSSGGPRLNNPGMMPPLLRKTRLTFPGLLSALSRSKARLGRRDETKKDGDTKDEKEKDHRLFDVIPPQPGVTCTLKAPSNLPRSQAPFGEHDGPVSGCGMGPHQHDLVPGPPAVIPVSLPQVGDSSSSPSPSRRASISTAASELLQRARSKSNAIISDTILPPVQAQVDVLTEIGRRVSIGVQAGVGSVMTRGIRDNRQRTDDHGESGYGYSLPQHQGPASPHAADNERSVSSGGSGSLTPPEERYHKDLEAGKFVSLPTTRPRAKTDSAVATGSNRSVYQAGGVSGAAGGPLRNGGEGGLVRRSNVRRQARHHHHPHQRKRVSWADGFISPPAVASANGSDAHGERRSGFSFLRRGSGNAGRPVDEEMASHDGLGYGEYDVRSSDQRLMQLV